MPARAEHMRFPVSWRLAVCCAAAALAGCGSSGSSGPDVLTAPIKVVRTTDGTVAYRNARQLAGSVPGAKLLLFPMPATPLLRNLPGWDATPLPGGSLGLPRRSDFWLGYRDRNRGLRCHALREYPPAVRYPPTATPRVSAAQWPDKTRTRQRPAIRALCAPAAPVVIDGPVKHGIIPISIDRKPEASLLSHAAELDQLLGDRYPMSG
jgi:hypothetical protein